MVAVLYWRGRAAKKEKKETKKRKMIPPARRFPIPRHGVGMGSGCGRDQSVVARTARGWCEVALTIVHFTVAPATARDYIALGPETGERAWNVESLIR